MTYRIMQTDDHISPAFHLQNENEYQAAAYKVYLWEKNRDSSDDKYPQWSIRKN